MINLNLTAVVFCLIVGSMSGFDLNEGSIINLILSFVNLVAYSLDKMDEKEYIV